MHALVVHRGGSPMTVERSHVQGFEMYAAELKRDLGFTSELVVARTLREVEAAVIGRPADVAFIMVSWSEPAAEVVSMFRRLSGRPSRPKLVFLDYFAPASSPYFGVLPHVDTYFKRQTYRDPSNYQGGFEGGNRFTNYLSQHLGISLDGWYFGGTPDPAQIHKLTTGWNLGVTRRCRQLLRLGRHMPLPWQHRPFAVNCRLGLSPGPRAKTEWYHHYRELGVRSVAPLREEYRCTGSDRVGLRQYLAEMILSKIAISPFGWGEVCFRDYEAVAAGALLVKPSMSHLQSNPNIYDEGKTYVACEWDMSDVPEICRYYLTRPDEAKAIILGGQEALHRYYEEGGFVGNVRRILTHAGLPIESNAPLPRRAFAVA